MQLFKAALSQSLNVCRRRTSTFLIWNITSVYLEECKCSSLEFSKEKTEKIRDGTKSLSDVC